MTGLYENYDVTERASSRVLEVPNPDPYSDDYFHGANPHAVGFGSRGLETENIGGENVNEGIGQQQPSQQGGPDESWTKAELQDEAERRGIDVPSNANKSELLDALQG